MNEIRGRNELDRNVQGISHASRVTEYALEGKLPKHGEGKITHYRGPKSARTPSKSSYHQFMTGSNRQTAKARKAAQKASELFARHNSAFGQRSVRHADAVCGLRARMAAMDMVRSL